MRSRLHAVIDVGTNSVKLLVGAVTGTVVEPLLETSRQTRLGHGFYESRLLQAEPIAHTAEAVAAFALEARRLEAGSLRVIATSAAREAVNRADLCQAIRRAASLEVEVISGEQEAAWAFGGVISDPRLAGGNILILDVGGGSSQVILGEPRGAVFGSSFPMGAVRLTERLRPGDPPSAAELAACREWLRAFLREHLTPALAGPLAGLPAAGNPLQLVATGGTATILARLEHGMTDFQRDRLEHTRLGRARVTALVEHLWSLPLATRRQVPGMPANRADILLMGVAIYEAVLGALGVADLQVSTRGLRFGALLAQAQTIR